MATVEEGIEVYQDVVTSVKLGRFNLLNWICENDVITEGVLIKTDERPKTKLWKRGLTLHDFWACDGLWTMTRWKSVVG